MTSPHAKCVFIELNHGFLFLALMVFFFTQADNFAHGLAIETISFKLGINFFNVIGDCFLFFFKAFDTLDK